MRPRPRLVASLGVVLSCTAGAAACSGDHGSAGPITAALERLPISAGVGADGEDPEDWTEVRFADIGRAAEVAGVPRPSGDRTADDFVDLMVEIASATPEPGAPYVVVPSNLDGPALQGADAVLDETGLSLSALDTAAEVSNLPQQFTALTGELALGGALVQDGDLLRAGEGEEFGIGGPPTPLRRLGRPWFFDEQDDVIGMSPSSSTLVEWRDGAETLADDPGFGPIATALDPLDPYTALVLRGDFGFVPPGLLTDSDDIEDARELVPEVAPFLYAAVAEFVDEGAPTTVVAYRFFDSAAADDAVAPLTAAWSDLRTFDGERDLAALIDGVSASADGPVVVVELDTGGVSMTRIAISLLYRRDAVFSFL